MRRPQRYAKKSKKLTSSELSWSEWLEFNKENISKLPQSSGVFRMHTNMKMMYIGDAENLQKRLEKILQEPCTCDAKRFCYVETPDFAKIKEELINAYKEKHDGKLPKCMEN